MTGMLVYIAVVVKLAVSAPPELLATDQLVMSRIALWGPIIPIGLAAATLSSAIGSILVAPRTLQALAGDGILPVEGHKSLSGPGHGAEQRAPECDAGDGWHRHRHRRAGKRGHRGPDRVHVLHGDLRGPLCHLLPGTLRGTALLPTQLPFQVVSELLGGRFSASSSCSRWIRCTRSPAIVVMALLYRGIRATRKDEVDDLSAIFHGVMTQLTRYLQIRLQKTPPRDWRPSVILITPRTFDRISPQTMLSWLCHRYGFGTYLHFIKGMLDRETFLKSQGVKDRLIEGIEETDSAIYVDTIISPSMASALAQSLQVPGVSGMENNTILFEFSIHDPPEVLEEVMNGCLMASAPMMNRLVLRHSDHFFGNRKNIHVWLTWNDYRNANLMVLLSYILLGHPDWAGAEIHTLCSVPLRRDTEREGSPSNHDLGGPSSNRRQEPPDHSYR